MKQVEVEEMVVERLQRTVQRFDAMELNSLGWCVTSHPCFDDWPSERVTVAVAKDRVVSDIVVVMAIANMTVVVVVADVRVIGVGVGDSIVLA